MPHRILGVTAAALLIAACSGTAKEATPSISPSAELDQMDARAPLPLQPMMANHQKQNMREHLEAVQGVVAALAVDDFAEVERAAGRMGYSVQMGQMCMRMGAGTKGFSEQALKFHHTADRIADAARKRDRALVLAELGATLQTCTSCHAAWKQQVVDASTWQRLVATAAPADTAAAAHEMTH
jgi:cytochrome c556